MNGAEFWTMIHDEPQLEWLGVHGDCIYVDHIGSNSGAFEIPVKTVLDEEWETLLTMLLENRPIKVLGHLSRIVGYFSAMRNWNRSKLAEGRDRTVGDYALGSSANLADSRGLPLEIIAYLNELSGGAVSCPLAE